MHALLFVIVIVAPAFLPEKPRVSTPVINLVNARELDAILRAAEAPPTPAPVSAPTPAPVAPAVVEPVPVPKAVEPPRPIDPTPPPTPKPAEPVKKKEVAKEPPPKAPKVEPRTLAVTPKGKEAPVKNLSKKAKEPEPPTPKAAPTKSTIKIADTTKNLVSRKNEEEAKAKQRAADEERALSVAAAKAEQQAQLIRVAKMKSILGGIQGGLSSPVDIHIDAGGGPNALAFLDYGQMMVRIYEQMWLVPPSLGDSLSVVGVTVTVARNGRVLEWDLRKPSGNSAVDKSVRETLQKVIQFDPFPASFRESQRTFNIDFNLKAKRTSG